MNRKLLLTIAVILLIIIIIACMCIGVFYLLGNAASNAGAASSSSTVTETVVLEGGDDKIAIIDVKGIILDSEESGSLFGGTVASTDRIIEELDLAMQDENTKAIILNIDSPGGGVYPSDLIYEKVKEVRDSGKPVVALMRSIAASGGYYVAAPADKIIASELTITGSIGVVLEVQNLDGLYEKLGIETVTITNTGGENKTDEGLFDNDPDGEAEQIYQQLVDEAYNRFVEVIAEGRGMSVKDVKSLADGRVYTGMQAKDNGLVDEIGTFEDALLLAQDLSGVSDPTVIQYQELDFFSLLTGAFSQVFDPTAQLSRALGSTRGIKLDYRVP